MDGTSASSSTDAARIASADPKAFMRAFLRAGPTPSISSRMECTCPFERSSLWYSIANRCASSWILVISLNPSEFLSMGISLLNHKQRR